MRIIPISHHSTQRPKCQNNICRIAEKNLVQVPQAPQVPPLQQLQPQSTSIRENVPENNDDCQSSDCHKCKCKCNHESEKRVVVIQNNNTTTTNQEEILSRRRGGGGDYGGGYCYPSACYPDPCSSLGYVSPIRGPCWNLPPPPLPIFQPGFSGYGYGGGYGNFCPVRPPF